MADFAKNCGFIDLVRRGFFDEGPAKASSGIGMKSAGGGSGSDVGELGRAGGTVVGAGRRGGVAATMELVLVPKGIGESV